MLFIAINTITVGHYDSLNRLKVVVLTVTLDNRVPVRKSRDSSHHPSARPVRWAGSCILSLPLSQWIHFKGVVAQAGNPGEEPGIGQQVGTDQPINGETKGQLPLSSRFRGKRIVRHY